MSVYRSLRIKLALGVGLVAAIVAPVIWVANHMLKVESRTGTPLGLSVRTDEHIATLIQSLEPYIPSLHRDPSKDRYRVGLFLVPLDGSSPTRLVPVIGNQPSSAFNLAKVLGSDGRTVWFDVAGIGGVDLKTSALVTEDDLRRANPTLPANWADDMKGMVAHGRLRLTSRDRQRVLEFDPQTHRAAAPTTPAPVVSPFDPTPATYLGAGLFISDTTWLGLHSAAEVQRVFKPKSWLRRIVHAEDAKELRRFHRGVLEPPSGEAYQRIISMTPLRDEEYLNAAFVRMNDTSEPLRLSEPDGALMIHTSAPGLKGTLMVARVDTDGNIVWKIDTGIDRWKLAQILPGARSTAFVGTRPMVPGKVPEPLLVILDHATGTPASHSLWQ